MMRQADHQQSWLLSGLDPDPVELVNAHSDHPVVLVCEHAGQAVPTSLNGLGLPPGALDAHIGWDIGAREVTLRLAAATDRPLPVKGPLTSVAWPARCQGALAALSPSDCGIDRDKAQSLLTEIARKALKDKAKQRINQTIEDKAPEALKDLLKGLLGS